jgi:hypothetical protein
MIRVIAVRQGPYICHDHLVSEDMCQAEVAGYMRRSFTICCFSEDDDDRVRLPKPKQKYLIKRWSSEDRRMFFWTVPWARKDETGTVVQTGGWGPLSKFATIYGDPDEAERVNLIRALGGTVDVAR